jgi:alpha-D-ribose 1-methylphosphonate 5-triphosphate synthase subunit PhnG
MKRRRRTELLIQGSREIAARLSAEIQKRHDVQTVEEPNNGLVMVKMRETSRKSLFYLGEVFVTEAKVRIGHTLGIGIVKGHEPELAHALAVIDAAYNAGLPETERWTEALEAEERSIEQRRSAISAGVLNTKVNFDTMAVD